MSVFVGPSSLGGSQPWRLTPLKHPGLPPTWSSTLPKSPFASLMSPFCSLPWPAETCSPQHLHFPLSRIFHLRPHRENRTKKEFSLLSFTKPSHLHIFAPILFCYNTKSVTWSNFEFTPACAVHHFHSNTFRPLSALRLSAFSTYFLYWLFHKSNILKSLWNLQKKEKKERK